MKNQKHLSELRPLANFPSRIKFESPTLCRPKYLDGPPILPGKEKENEIFGNRVDGWCMFPNLWDSDLLLIRGIAPMKIERGRDLEGNNPLCGAELLRWNAFNKQIVSVSIDGKPSVKRIFLNVGGNPPALFFMPDNRRMFSRPLFVSGAVEIVLRGVVEMVVPIDRDPTRLPIEIRDEYERVYNADGSRRTINEMEEKTIELLKLARCRLQRTAHQLRQLGGEHPEKLLTSAESRIDALTKSIKRRRGATMVQSQ